VVVPWQAVLETALEGDQLFIEVDSRVTPLNKLRLTAFAAGAEELPSRELVRRRLVVRIASAGLATTAALAALRGRVARAQVHRCRSPSQRRC
jgi:hypothetical protein